MLHVSSEAFAETASSIAGEVLSLKVAASERRVDLFHLGAPLGYEAPYGMTARAVSRRTM
jgi:hypothetical protein